MLKYSIEYRKYTFSWIAFLALMFLIIFGSYIMPHRIDPLVLETYHWETVNSKMTIINAPFPPNSNFWLGTDHRGYDLLSLLLNGGKYTFAFCLAVTAARFAISLPFGLFVGASGRGKVLLNSLHVATTSVPSLLYLVPSLMAVFFGLKLTQGSAITEPRNAFFTVLMFGLFVMIGIFPLAHQISLRTKFFNEKLFVLAARNMGASLFRITGRHILPQMYPELLVAFLMEYVQVLFLITQVAVFDVFLGGADSLTTDFGVMLFTNVGEWGGLITYGIHNYRYYPWLVLYPCLFVTISVIILSFFAKQLQKRIQHRQMYKIPPVYKSKLIVCMVTTMVLASIVLVVLVPNKSPAAAASVQLIPVQKQVQYTKLAELFMVFVQEGQWQSIDAYLEEESPLKTSKDPMEIFKEWNRKLKQGYRFGSVGLIQKKDNFIEVELRLTEANGTPQSWYFELSTFSGLTRIYSAH